MVQPQMPAPLLILMSMLTLWPMGFGLGPKVMLEVVVVPDCTALMDAFDTLAAFAKGEMFDAPKAEIKDIKMSTLISM